MAPQKIRVRPRGALQLRALFARVETFGKHEKAHRNGSPTNRIRQEMLFSLVSAIELLKDLRRHCEVTFPLALLLEFVLACFVFFK